MDRNITILDLNVDGLDRGQIRSKILDTWNAESQGSGIYRYNVETCSDNSRIYLLRPARLNKGCDFAIVSENFLKFKNGNDKPPKHDDIFNLIRDILENNIISKDEFQLSAERVYNCENISEVLSTYPNLLSTPNCKAERAVKLLKWIQK